MNESTTTEVQQATPTRRALFGGLGRGALVVVAALATPLKFAAPAKAHNLDCQLVYASDSYCSYNCWRYAGYHGYAWVSPSGHNWCFECTTGSNCWSGSSLCSEWGHM